MPYDACAVTPRGQMKASGGMSGADLDAARRRNTAYEYLCHLEEARQYVQPMLHAWVSVCARTIAFTTYVVLRAHVCVARIEQTLLAQTRTLFSLHTQVDSSVPEDRAAPRL